MKLNIGSAVSGILALNGADVHMVSKTEKKLHEIKRNLENITGSNINYSSLNLFDRQSVRKFVAKLPKDKPIYWVQSVGLGAGSYKLKDDNPYLPIDKIPLELLNKECDAVLRSVHIMMQEFLPIFKKQSETRIVIISSMSAIRGYEIGAAHCAAKGAIDRYSNSATLSLYKENIFITSLRPGIVDTGMYDGKSTIDAVKTVGKSYGVIYKGKHIPLAPPSSIGEAVKYILSTSSHPVSLNLVARGQWPNEGS